MMGMNPELLLSLLAIGLIVVACLSRVVCSSGAGFEWALAFPLLLTAAIELFDLLIQQSPGKFLFVKSIAFPCEALVPLGWAAYVWSLSGRNLWQRTAGNGLLWGVCLLLVVLAVSPTVTLLIQNADSGLRLLIGPTGLYFYLLLTFSLVGILVWLERSFSLVSRQYRFALKLEVLGIGAIIAMQLVYYSQGVLYRALDMALLPARRIAIIVGLLLFLYARLRRKRPIQMQLSHAAAFRSVVLLVVSIYLVLLGLAGEGGRYMGEDARRAFMFCFALLGGLVVSIVLLSESLRRKTRVFLHKHFFRQKYDYRKLWLEMTERLGGARTHDAVFATTLDIYCRTFAVKDAALYLYRGDEAGLALVAVHGGIQPPERFESDGSLVGFLTERNWVFNLRDNSDEIASTAAAELQQHDIQFVVPLLFSREFVGAIALSRQVNVDEPLIYEDYDLMKIVGRQISAVLFSQRLSHQLADHREMAAVGKVSAFVMHDLKNLVANLSLVVGNAREFIHDPRFQKDMLETLENSVGRMNGLIGRLKNVGETPPLSCEPYNLKQLVRETIDEIGSDAIDLSGDDVNVVIDRSEIGKVVTNLVRNGIEASPADKTVQVVVGNKCGPLLVCRDEGCGMTDDFMDLNLFRPFETTKKKGLGVGLYQSRQIVEAHGGRIEVISAPGKGSEFRVYLPMTLETEGMSDG